MAYIQAATVGEVVLIRNFTTAIMLCEILGFGHGEVGVFILLGSVHH